MPATAMGTKQDKAKVVKFSRIDESGVLGNIGRFMPRCHLYPFGDPTLQAVVASRPWKGGGFHGPTTRSQQTASLAGTDAALAAVAAYRVRVLRAAPAERGKLLRLATRAEAARPAASSAVSSAAAAVCVRQAHAGCRAVSSQRGRIGIEQSAATASSP